MNTKILKILIRETPWSERTWAVKGTVKYQCVIVARRRFRERYDRGEQSSVNNDISNKGVNTIAGVFLSVVFMSAAVSNSEFDNKKNLV